MLTKSSAGWLALCRKAAVLVILDCLLFGFGVLTLALESTLTFDFDGENMGAHELLDIGWVVVSEYQHTKR